MIRYGSVSSGIEAATMAWHPLGWAPVFFSEIAPFPSAVLAHHYGSNMPGEPLSKNGIPNHGDFTKIGADAGPIDLLVGGTPCQSFSVAGKRLGLDDPRGNLALEYLALARRLNARWFVWENVPGVLSSRSGHEAAETGEEDEGGVSTAPISRPSSVSFANAGMGSPTVFSTLNMSEWTATLVPFPNDGGVSSLSDILETGDVLPQYYLSPKACAGILRRAEKRGKELPQQLQAALPAVADSAPTLISTED